jgi:hypothetical protein
LHCSLHTSAIRKKQNKNGDFFVLSFCATIKHRCVTHLYHIPLFSFYQSVEYVLLCLNLDLSD